VNRGLSKESVLPGTRLADRLPQRAV